MVSCRPDFFASCRSLALSVSTWHRGIAWLSRIWDLFSVGPAQRHHRHEDAFQALAQRRQRLLHFARYLPYRALMESYDKAQSVEKVGHETKLDRLMAGQAKR